MLAVGSMFMETFVSIRLTITELNAHMCPYYNVLPWGYLLLFITNKIN
jgi:hypothetical protein